MGTVIFAIIFGIILVIGIFALIYGRKNDYAGVKVSGVAMIAFGGIATLVTMILGTWVSNDVGKAHIFVDSINPASARFFI